MSDRRTVSTSLGLVHNVTTAAWHGGGFVTTCKRSYVKTPLDEPPRIVTCIWCVARTSWPTQATFASLKDVATPQGKITAFTNPCAEVPLDDELEKPRG